jgi:four helix bundle protein
MTKITSYKDLIVWQKSYTLTQNIYTITEHFPKKEDFSLTSQMRRCSLSIPSNIAEGYRRSHRKEFIQFLQIAFGSASELEVQLLLSKDIGYISDNEYEETGALLTEILKMINVMLSKMKSV